MVLGKAWAFGSTKWTRLRKGTGDRRESSGLTAEQIDLVRRYAPNRSFVDVGCMWRVHGAVAFVAEDAGATAVTAFDAMEPTPEYTAEHERRGSKVRFVRGDLNSDGFADDVGVHDVVWCSGVLYHSPNPLIALANVGKISADYVIIGTKTIPEVPGLPQAAVFFPGLSTRQRKAYAPMWDGAITAPYDPTPERSYANWWWGLTPSSIEAMFGLGGWHVVETLTRAWTSVDDNFFIVAQRD